MSAIKLITGINWVLISSYGAFVLWAMLQKANPSNDAGGSEQEVALKATGVVLWFVLIGLNRAAYSWTKVMALLLVVLLLLLIRYIATH